MLHVKREGLGVIFQCNMSHRGVVGSFSLLQISIKSVLMGVLKFVLQSVMGHFVTPLSELFKLLIHSFLQEHHIILPIIVKTTLSIIGF